MNAVTYPVCKCTVEQKRLATFLRTCKFVGFIDIVLSHGALFVGSLDALLVCCDTDSDANESYRVCNKDFGKFVRSCKGDIVVEIEQIEEGQSLTLYNATAGSKTFDWRTGASYDRLIKSLTGDPVHEPMNKDDVTKLKRVYQHTDVPDESNRFVLSAVKLDGDKMIGTDGRRLIAMSCSHDFDVENDNVLLPKLAIRYALAIKATNIETVSKGTGQEVVCVDDALFLPVEGRFPDYTKVMAGPLSYIQQIVVDTKDLLAACNKIKTEIKSGVRVEDGSTDREFNGLVIKVTSNTGNKLVHLDDAKHKLDHGTTVDEYEGTFNHKFLLDAIDPDSETTMLCVATPEGKAVVGDYPLLIRAGDYDVVIMPMASI